MAEPQQIGGTELPRRTKAELEAAEAEAAKQRRADRRRERRLGRKVNAALAAGQLGADSSAVPGVAKKHDNSPTAHKNARQSLINVFEALGGEAGMAKWGAKNPTEFYRLFGRMVKPDTATEAPKPLEDLLAELARRGAGLAGPAAGAEDLGSDDDIVAGAASLLGGSAGDGPETLQ